MYKRASWRRPNREIRAASVIVILNLPVWEMFFEKLSGSPRGGGVSITGTVSDDRLL